MLWKFTKYSLNKTNQNATKSNQYYQSMQFNLQKLQKLQMQYHLKKTIFHYSGVSIKNIDILPNRQYRANTADSAQEQYS